MLNEFLSYIREKKLVQTGEKVLLAVSGGKDSMAMTHLFKQTPFEIAIAHINHQLRGTESDEDARFVESYAEQNKIPYFQLDINPIDLSYGNLQEKARQLRYSWLFEVAEKHQYNKIATAHHLDDRVETFFINLMRGSGLDGLESFGSSNGAIIRPLLFALRKDIDTYVDQYNIPYREDSSNQSNKYVRNNLRNNILPLIYKADQRAPSGIQISIDHLNDTSILLDFLVQKASAELVNITDEYTSIQIKNFQNDTIGIQWLFQLIKKYGFNVIQVQEMMLSKSSSGKIFISSAYEALLDRGNLIVRSKAKVSNISINQQIDTLPFMYQVFDKQIFINEEKGDKIELINEGNVLFLNAEKINGTVILRNIRPGDKFKPYGMRGKSQKIKDFLVNQKVHLFEKEKIMVLEYEGEIIAIPGWRIAESVKVDQNTRKIWKIELKLH